MFSKVLVSGWLWLQKMMIRTWIFAAVLGAAATAAAEHLDDVQEDLVAERQKWQSNHITEYTYRFQRICFCLPEFTEPGIVTVSNGKIASVMSTIDGNSLDPSVFLTIDGLFDVLQAAIDSHAGDVVANYDASFGYPVSLDIDYVLGAVDDEISFRAGEFERCVPVNSLLGDLDGNGEVAFADFLKLADNFGQQDIGYSGGDVNCDGTVAFDDFLTLAENFGKTAGAVTAVPEPSSVLLIAVGGLLLFPRRRLSE